MAEVAEMVKVGSHEWAFSLGSAEYEARKARDDEEALTYLRVKFPGVNESAFFTDYRGNVSKHVQEAGAVMKASKIERTCSQCEGKCSLPDRKGKPVVNVEESPAGFKYLEIRWTCGIFCRYDPLSGEFGRMFRASGLTSSQLNQTFTAYETSAGKELGAAKQSAILAAKNSTGLVLSGKRGTGKTHLAVAIALYAMKHGHQAIFRLVNELLNEIRRAVAEKADYYGVIQRFKEVPCLVLDDLGKERTTDFGLDALYDIVDYRYRHELQTIITTNAKTIEELASWGNSEYTTPMVSRVMERGAWVTISNADDYRVKRGVKP